MAIVVAVLAFLVGAAVGAVLAVWWLRRRPVAEPSLEAAPAAGAHGQPGTPAAPEAGLAAETTDPDLKPILDATRGVLTDLEERYRGRRSGKQDG